MSTFYSICTNSLEKNGDLFLSLLTADYAGQLKCDEPWLLAAFLASMQTTYKKTEAQLLQDLFAHFIVGGRAPRTFIEFGATDGRRLSNSLYLERDEGWTGLLCEPSPRLIKMLKENRPNTPILTECIWSETGHVVEFFVSEVDPLSTISCFRYSDEDGMSGNVEYRNKAGSMVPRRTISLNDVIETHFGGKCPSYMSVDTEGSEYEILSHFDFARFRPTVLTVEHNHTSIQGPLDDLLAKANFTRVFRSLTEFDGWYVDNDTLAKIKAEHAG